MTSRVLMLAGYAASNNTFVIVEKSSAPGRVLSLSLAKNVNLEITFFFLASFA